MTDGNRSAMNIMAIHEQNIMVNMVAGDRVEVIQKLGGLLFENGYVKDTYVDAVLKREEVFPTGLQTTLLGMAIPHTDTEHVIDSTIAIATLAHPVIFQGMGMPDTDIPVTIVMMLAVSDPKAVMNVLRSVLFILENKDALRGITAATSALEIKQIVQNHIQGVASLIFSEEADDKMH